MKPMTKQQAEQYAEERRTGKTTLTSRAWMEQLAKRTQNVSPRAATSRWRNRPQAQPVGTPPPANDTKPNPGQTDPPQGGGSATDVKPAIDPIAPRGKPAEPTPGAKSQVINPPVPPRADGEQRGRFADAAREKFGPRQPIAQRTDPPVGGGGKGLNTDTGPQGVMWQQGATDPARTDPARTDPPVGGKSAERGPPDKKQTNPGLKSGNAPDEPGSAGSTMTGAISAKPAGTNGPVDAEGNDAGTDLAGQVQSRLDSWGERMLQMERGVLDGTVSHAAFMRENQRYEAFAALAEEGNYEGALAAQNPFEGSGASAAVTNSRDLGEINAERARQGLRPISQEVYEALPERGAQQAAREYGTEGGRILSNEYAGERQLESFPRMSQIIAGARGDPAEIQRRMQELGATSIIDDVSGMTAEQLAGNRYGAAIAQWTQSQGQGQGQGGDRQHGAPSGAPPAASGDGTLKSGSDRQNVGGSMVNSTAAPAGTAGQFTDPGPSAVMEQQRQQSQSQPLGAPRPVPPTSGRAPTAPAPTPRPVGVQRPGPAPRPAPPGPMGSPSVGGQVGAPRPVGTPIPAPVGTATDARPDGPPVQTGIPKADTRQQSNSNWMQIRQGMSPAQEPPQNAMSPPGQKNLVGTARNAGRQIVAGAADTVRAGGRLVNQAAGAIGGAVTGAANALGGMATGAASAIGNVVGSSADRIRGMFSDPPSVPRPNAINDNRGMAPSSNMPSTNVIRNDQSSGASPLTSPSPQQGATTTSSQRNLGAGQLGRAGDEAVQSATSSFYNRRGAALER